MFNQPQNRISFKKIVYSVGRGLISIITWPIAAIASFPKIVKIYRDPNLSAAALLFSDSRNHSHARTIQRTSGCCYECCCESSDRYSIFTIFSSENLLERRYLMTKPFFKYQNITLYGSIGAFVLLFAFTAIPVACALSFSAPIPGFKSLSDTIIDLLKFAGIAGLVTPSFLGACISIFDKNAFLESIFQIYHPFQNFMKPCIELKLNVINETRISYILNTLNHSTILKLQSNDSQRIRLNKEIRDRVSNIFNKLQESPTNFPDEINNLTLTYIFDKDTLDAAKLSKCPYPNNQITSEISIDIDDIKQPLLPI